MKITFITDEELFERLKNSAPFYDGYRVHMIPKSESAPPILLSTKEAARMLGISEKSVRRLVAEKKLLPIEIDGKNFKFTREQLEEFARSETVSSRKPVVPRQSTLGVQPVLPHHLDDEDHSPEALLRELKRNRKTRR